MGTMKALKRGAGAALFCGALASAFAQQAADQFNINSQLVFAAKAGRIERVAALLGDGAAVNSRDRNGDSALQYGSAQR